MTSQEQEFEKTGDEFLDSYLQEELEQEEVEAAEEEDDIDNDLMDYLLADDSDAEDIFENFGTYGLNETKRQFYNTNFKYDQNKANKLYEYTLGKTNNPILASAIIGNAITESNLNPEAVHDSGTGYGMFGHRDPQPGQGRKTGLLNYLNKNKNQPLEEAQIDYVLHELSTGYSGTLNKILNTKSPEQAAEIFANEFERPAKKYANIDKRKYYASKLYNKFQSGGALLKVYEAAQAADKQVGSFINSGFEMYKDLKSLSPIIGQVVSNTTSTLDTILGEQNQAKDTQKMLNSRLEPIYEEQLDDNIIKSKTSWI